MPANHNSASPLYRSEEEGEGYYRPNGGYHYLHQNSNGSLVNMSIGGGGTFQLREGMGLDRNANQVLDRIGSDKDDGESHLYDYHTTGTRVHIPPDDIYVHSSSSSKGKYNFEEDSLSISSHCCCNCSNCYYNSSGKQQSFPKERKKTLVGFALLVGGFICNSFSIFLTHQRIPDRTLHPPLPDLSLDNIVKRRWLNDVSDVIVIICTVTTAVLIVSHRHRWILARRSFLILSILYTARSITMTVTVLPLANDHVYCSPKLNSTSFGDTLWVATKEVMKLMGAGGLGFMGKKTLCGDYIFSGHTIIYVISFLMIKEYTPKRFATLHWAIWLLSWIGILGLLVSHGHYTIDVILGYYATTRLFWIYHALANGRENKRRSDSNHLSQVWWFPVFRYFECNVHGRIPHEYSVPKLWKKSRLSYAYKTLQRVS